MKLIKGFALVLLAVVVIVIGYGLLALSGDKGAAVSVKALPQAKIAGYLMPVREATIDYSTYTIRQLKAAARGTGIKSWEKLRKAELIGALSAMC
jgi:ABC-type proline/glycine betaine transport system permease subunit